MKQLLIVNSHKALNATNATPLAMDKLEEGAIMFFELGENTPLSAAPTKDFGIALGRGAGTPPFIIPEVDLKTLEVTMSEPEQGHAFEASITIPDPPENLITGMYYTILLIKKGVGFNQRYQWSASTFVPVGVTKTAAQIATELGNQLKEKAKYANIPMDITVADEEIHLAATDDSDWTLMGADSLSGVSVTVGSPVSGWKKAIGDKAYVMELARKCAGGKGFLNTGSDSLDLYPSYPETVEDTTYNIFNLKFATGRKGQKTTDERVWQYVHIAVPASSAALETIETILGVAEESEGEGGGGQS